MSAQGLPIADVAISPRDAALYFLIGGRGTQSGIYRVTYQGVETTAPAPETKLDQATEVAQKLRRRLEAFHGQTDPVAVSEAWPHLGHENRAIRGAARAALEWQPVNEWKQRALEERNPRIALQALLALSRSTDGDSTIQAALLAALDRLDVASLSLDEQCWYLRIITISASRHGKYSESVASRLIEKLEPMLPSTDRRINEEIVSMCAPLRSKSFIAPTLDLLEQSRTQEEQIVYLQALINSRESTAWTPELRERLLKLTYERVPHWKGGATARAVRYNALHVVPSMLPETERTKYGDLISLAQKPPTVIPATTRKFVQKWTMDDLASGLDEGLAQKRDLANGRRLFTATSCIVCHSFEGEGGLGGPDLTSAGRRYNSRDLLDNILNPSKTINEQYGMLIYSMKDGKTHIGRTVNMAGDTVMVTTNPNDPGGSEIRFKTNELESTTPSKISFMPEGLLNTLSKDEVLDMLAYIKSK